ncbi:putative GTP-binding protein 6 [Exaiptasia diaphana]|uniref:Hflx-type G domain-containing protein n=1 Tax=Exaiptasia diaphana TaxID=2652724 RepID=A0A913XG77_EXADI|nr:putative GTP-binding protein 6 [Exaiptasia diaphana]KXJ12335.1 putative GTP-binding protein 6 [Exaiptasia diaphana]
MHVFFAKITRFCSVRHSFVGRKILGGHGCIFVCRNLSQEFTHDFEDDHPETQEILRKLRQKHHHYGITGHQKKIQDVMVIEPDYKWGRHRFQKATASHRLEEACGLVEAISNWQVKFKSIESVRKIDHKMFFGKGKIEELTERINQAKASDSLDVVYIDVGRLSAGQYKELEKLWDVKVLDRFGIVLQIFKERAKTGEAKIQVELAEIPYLKSRLVGDETVKYDQQRGGTHYIGGSGETQLEKERRVLSEREIKIKKKLENLKKHRNHIRHERHKRHVPIVSVVGYTNAGKTTLIKAITGDAKMKPDNKLFATLDVTAHAGKLPSGLHALFIDTVGFVSDLPPELVDSFSATLEDVVNSDLIVHVQDISHPDHEAQREDVMSILKQQLKLKTPLLDNIVEVNNKVDLCSKDFLDEISMPNTIQSSALRGTGLDVLLSKIEQGILQSTGRMMRKVVIPPEGPQLSWLYHEATVQATDADEDGFITATVIMDEATNKKFEKKFGSILTPFIFKVSSKETRKKKKNKQ